jgi:hypothetical protein
MRMSVQTWQFNSPKTVKEYRAKGLIPKVGDEITGVVSSGIVTEARQYTPVNFIFYYERQA